MTYDGAVDAFTKRLEDDVAAIKTDLAVVRSNYATKADLSGLANSLIKWMIATTVGVVAAMISVAVGAVTVLTFLLNNASSKPVPSSAPIVITVPYPVPANGPLPPRPSQKQEGSPQAPLN